MDRFPEILTSLGIVLPMTHNENEVASIVGCDIINYFYFPPRIKYYKWRKWEFIGEKNEKMTKKKKIRFQKRLSLAVQKVLLICRLDLEFFYPIPFYLSVMLELVKWFDFILRLSSIINYSRLFSSSFSLRRINFLFNIFSDASEASDYS